MKHGNLIYDGILYDFAQQYLNSEYYRNEYGCWITTHNFFMKESWRGFWAGYAGKIMSKGVGTY